MYLRSGRAEELEAQLRPPRTPSFDSFFLAGFECSDHRLHDGRRLDLLASTRHDALPALDYARVRRADMAACRDGVSWVRCERSPGVYCFDSWRPRLCAAEGVVSVVWDLMHFGWPDHVDVFARNFPEHFAAYARAVARFYRQHSKGTRHDRGYRGHSRRASARALRAIRAGDQHRAEPGPAAHVAPRPV